MSLTSIPPLLDRLPLDFRPGQFHEANDPISCPSRKIPTLESVFQAFPDTDINIDIKDHDPELAKQVLPLFENTTLLESYYFEVWKRDLIFQQRK